MKLLDQNTAQKLRGGYYTQQELTSFILDWAFSDGKKNKILEPSCGDGAFIENLNNSKYDDFYSNCLAVELIEEEAAKASDKVANNPKINIVNSDFFDEFNWKLRSEKYDLIIGNPPYIRYQYLTPIQRDTQSDILVSNGMKANKLINAWVSFVVASVQMMGDNAKLGMVIPAELLQVAYAADLRQFLEKSLSKITVITFKELVFPDVQQEVVLLLAEKNNNITEYENKITVIECTNSYTLYEEVQNATVEYKQVDHSKDKWTKFFLTNLEITQIRSLIQDPRFVQFEEVAEVDIGITTGNNKYFSVNAETVEKYNLKDVTLPLIGRSAHAHGLYFNEKDWMINVDKGLSAQLVYFPNEDSSNFPLGHQAYINWGIQNGHNKGYKLGIRQNWYHIPSVWVPDAFFLRRNDMFPKFVLNEINAVSTDTMHRIRIKDGMDPKKLLLSYYNSVSFAFTEIEGRSYGGGVLEILPGEVEKVILPNIYDMDDETVTELLNKIDECIRNGKDIEPVLDLVDQKVLVDFIGLTQEQVDGFRGIWKKLMNRRRQRKAMKKKSV